MVELTEEDKKKIGEIGKQPIIKEYSFLNKVKEKTINTINSINKRIDNYNAKAPERRQKHLENMQYNIEKQRLELEKQKLKTATIKEKKTEEEAKNEIGKHKKNLFNLDFKNLGI